MFDFVVRNLRKTAESKSSRGENVDGSYLNPQTLFFPSISIIIILKKKKKKAAMGLKHKYMPNKTWSLCLFTDVIEHWKPSLPNQHSPFVLGWIFSEF